MKNELIFHIHIPKTAGTAVRSAMIDSGWIMANGYNQDVIADRGGNLISGHFMFGAFPRFRMGKKTTYVTVLRDPADLIVSMYNFCKELPNHPFYSLTVDGFDSFCRSSKFRNMQARYLAGRLVSFLYARRVIDDASLYRVASSHLKKIQFVGVQDDLNALLSELKSGGLFDLEVSSFERLNVQRKREREGFGEGIESFKALNEVDYALYRMVSERINKGA